MPTKEIALAGTLLKRIDELERTNEALQNSVTSLEAEIDAILTSFAEQELLVLDGYLVSVRPGIDTPFAAVCPKLRAVAQGDTAEEALADLREAMDLFLTCRRESGGPVPAKDVEG